MSSAGRFVLLAVVAACSGEGSTSASPPPETRAASQPEERATPPSPQVPAPLDRSGMHLDDDVPGRPTRVTTRRATRQVEITLRSTPPGATVSVDGVELGVTPQLWDGPTGKHEFTFTLPGHAMARYRFHVTTSGLVHARLDPVVQEPDAGKPPPELVSPTALSPSSIAEPVSPKLDPTTVPVVPQPVRPVVPPTVSPTPVTPTPAPSAAPPRPIPTTPTVQAAPATDPELGTAP